MSYFSHFPTTTFLGNTVADITRKAQLDTIAKRDALSYMNYTVQEGERPEDVAYFYYDDPSYAWLVLASNDIIDPYTQWPKNQTQFENYLKTHYAEASGTTGEGVLEWTKNATLGTNIIYYAQHSDPSIRLNRASYLNSDATERGKYFPLRVYDYEFQLNEERRQIVLMNKAYLTTLNQQLEAKLNAK